MSAEAQGNKSAAVSWGNRLMIAGVVVALIGGLIALTSGYTTSTVGGFMLLFAYSLAIGGGLGLLLFVTGLAIRIFGRK